MSRKIRDLIGSKFYHLTPIKVDHIKVKVGAYWLCSCSCGNTVIVRGSHLTSGHSRSCGHNDGRIPDHGDTRTRFYKIWSSLKERCLNINSKAYQWYGAKGVKISDNWLNDYKQFKADMWESYIELCNSIGEISVTLDRINPKGNYEKLNCRWLSRSDNTRLAKAYRKAERESGM